MDTNKKHDLYEWLFLEFFNKLRMNGCTKVVTLLKTECGEDYVMSSTDAGDEAEFISSFSSLSQS